MGEKLKVIIAGGRDFNDYDTLKTYCSHILMNKDDVEIVCGMAKGADLLGKKFAEENGFPVEPFPADWNDMSEPCVRKYNKYGYEYNALAGNKRNAKMAEYADALIAFWDGESTGTGDMIELAEKEELHIRIFQYNVT